MLEHARVDLDPVAMAVFKYMAMKIDGGAVVPHDHGVEVKPGEPADRHFLIGGLRKPSCCTLHRFSTRDAQRWMGASRNAQVERVDQRVGIRIVDADLTRLTERWRAAERDHQVRIRIDAGRLTGREPMRIGPLLRCVGGSVTGIRSSDVAGVVAGVRSRHLAASFIDVRSLHQVRGHVHAWLAGVRGAIAAWRGLHSHH